jgi:hypothetical protein
MLYKTIDDNNIKNNIAHFFALIYNPRDIKNKNKFKVGKMEINTCENTLYINIYGKPRDKCRKKYNAYNKKNIGGFRIRWNVYENTYKYVLPWNFEIDYYSCPGIDYSINPCADPWEVLNIIYFDIKSHRYLLYTENDSSIPITSYYNSLKINIIKLANEQIKYQLCSNKSIKKVIK